MSLLQVRNVSRHFGSLVAVREVSMTVEPGELRAVIGPNGAGKTTFFNLISGFFPPSAGSIHFDGKDITAWTAQKRVQHGMARTFQITEIFPELSVRENLRVPVEVASGLRLRPWLGKQDDARIRERVDQLLRMGGLTDKADRLVGELSHGDQRATEIMMSIGLKPRLLLLDEPTAGMGDQETYDITRLIRRLHRDEKLTHRADRARHARDLPSGRPHHGAGRRRDAGRGNGGRDRQGRARASGLPGEDRMNALEASGLHTFYGKSHILHGVGLQVREGEIVTLLGRNGAGKSTTMRSLMGLTPPREGTIRVFGQETTGWLPYRVAALGVGFVPEGRRVFANLTVDENLRVPLEREGPWNIKRVYELFPRLEERKGNKGRQLSGGEQEMLAIARALLLNPKLLMLDEPSQGLAPLIVKQVFEVIAQMRKEGMSILLVEQNVRAAVEIADRAYVLDDGRVAYEGAAAEFAKDEERVRALAGASAESWEQIDSSIVHGRAAVTQLSAASVDNAALARSARGSSWTEEQRSHGWPPPLSVAVAVVAARWTRRGLRLQARTRHHRRRLRHHHRHLRQLRCPRCCRRTSQRGAIR